MFNKENLSITKRNYSELFGYKDCKFWQRTLVCNLALELYAQNERKDEPVLSEIKLFYSSYFHQNNIIHFKGRLFIGTIWINQNFSFWFAESINNFSKQSTDFAVT